jgi:rhodanese-related sulfurtransferase
MKIFNSIILLALLVSFTNCKHESKKNYKLSPEETLAAYINKEDVISKEKLANILLCKKANSYQLVDLRTPHDYIINHIPGAINIPGKNILDEEYFSRLNQDDKILVLYCKGTSEVTNAYLILKQLGFKNI